MGTAAATAALRRVVFGSLVGYAIGENMGRSISDRGALKLALGGCCPPVKHGEGMERWIRRLYG